MQRTHYCTVKKNSHQKSINYGISYFIKIGNLQNCVIKCHLKSAAMFTFAVAVHKISLEIWPKFVRAQLWTVHEIRLRFSLPYYDSSSSRLRVRRKEKSMVKDLPMGSCLFPMPSTLSRWIRTNFALFLEYNLLYVWILTTFWTLFTTSPGLIPLFSSAFVA